MPASFQGRLPTIPEYYSDYIDKKVDLYKEPKQCCPFHKEDTPSFSFSAEKNVWRCFGGCKVGGGVIELHQKNYKLKSKEEALKSLNTLYGVMDRRSKTKLVEAEIFINEEVVERERLINKAIVNAITIERWLELDYVMSKYPVENAELSELLEQWSIH